jgi:carbamoyltransferase
MHAANAFFSSTFQEALIITLDGGGHEGPGVSTAFTVSYGHDNKVDMQQVTPIQEFNIGNVWDRTLRAVRLQSNGEYGNQAGTLMAMAAFGDPSHYIDLFRDMIFNYSKAGSIQKIKELSKRPAYRKHKDMDIAASLQLATEEKIYDIVKYWLNKSGFKTLCLAGGVALNSVVTGKLLKLFPDVKIYIPPVPYDAGLSIGATQYYYHQVQGHVRRYDRVASPYLGVKYGIKEVMAAIGSDYRQVADDEIIDLLEEQKIIAVFGGGAESGRRALGHRSILADPRSDTMKEQINEKVKHRQWFRPFAPSVLREDVAEWFDGDCDSPYMSFVLKFKADKRGLVPAVNHVDGSARLQTVTSDMSPWYHEFISQWKNRSGVPMLLNTSFNDREPIVETPTDAIRCFNKTNIDGLYFSDYGILLEKK